MKITTITCLYFLISFIHCQSDCSDADIEQVKDLYEMTISQTCAPFTSESDIRSDLRELDTCPAPPNPCRGNLSLVADDDCLSAYADDINQDVAKRISICLNLMECGFTSTNITNKLGLVQKDGQQCQPNPNSDNFTSTIALSLFVALLSLIIFIIIRPFFPTFYYPKALLINESWAPDDGKKFHLFWILEVFTYDHENFLSQLGGLDSLGILIFLKYGTIFIAIITFFGLVILMPINVTANNENIEDSIDLVTGLDRLTISNIRRGSSRMVAHLISVFGFTGIIYVFMYIIYYKFAHYVLKNGIVDETVNRSVLVRNFPKTITDPKDLKDLFSDIHGKDSILHALIIPNSGELKEIQKTRKAKLTNYKIHKELKEERNQIDKVKIGKIFSKRFGCCGEEMDAIDYYQDEIKSLDEKIKWLRESDVVPTNNGIIVFDSVRNASKCSQSLHDFDREKMKMYYAPSPKNIHWSYFDTKKYSKTFRIVIAYTLIVLIFLFWAVPITFFQAIANLEGLRSLGLDFLADILESNSFARSLVEDTIPSLGISIALALVPAIFNLIFRFRGYMLKTDLEREVGKIYWLFLLFNVLLVSSIAGSLFTLGDQLARNPSSVLRALGISLPTQATFFVNYLIIQGFISYSLILLRLPEIIGRYLKFLFLFRKPTSIEKEEIEKTLGFDYGVFHARTLIIFTIVIVYSSMAPLILPFGFLFFFLSWFITKYNMVYVHSHKFTGVRFMPALISRIGYSLIIYHFTMLAVFGLKEFPAGAAVFLLIPITLYYTRFLHRRFEIQTLYIPLIDCPSNSKNSWNPEDEELFVHPAYLQPTRIDDLDKRKGMKEGMKESENEVDLSNMGKQEE